MKNYNQDIQRLRRLLSKTDYELYLLEYFTSETSEIYLPYVTDDETRREIGREVRQSIKDEIAQLQQTSDAPEAS